MSTIDFNQNIIQIQNKLKYYALSLTSNFEDAQDLVQETILKAITFRNMFVHETNFTAWIFTIMKNTFINNYRKATRAKTTFDRTKDLFFINSGQKISIAPVDSNYAVLEIKQSINNLKDEYRIPFQMYIDGHKYKEISDDLDLPIGTVKSRIFFARKFLMDSLRDYQYNHAA
jgi:RNA polymerase sigma-70 factor (ECF subfamily)